MLRHELESFAAQCRLNSEQFSVHDLLTGPPGTEALAGCDALMVGGSGDYNVSKRNFPHIEATLDFFREVAAGRRPMFASCFGFHCLVEALGGEIIFDPQRVEVGTFELTLSPAGRRDELFELLPDTFMGQEGHKDRAARYADGLPNLVSSDNSPLQAFRIPGKPIWATQFHPELNRRTNLDRYERYLQNYAKTMTAAQRQAAFDGFVDSPETSRLLPAFLELVFG